MEKDNPALLILEAPIILEDAVRALLEQQDSLVPPDSARKPWSTQGLSPPASIPH